jgi:hypothetical protein
MALENQQAVGRKQTVGEGDAALARHGPMVTR